MDRKFLEEYEYKEQEECKRLNKLLMDGKLGPNDMMPPASRFPGLRNPVFHAFHLQKELSAPSVIWPQVPLAGSLIIHLRALPKEDFKRHHGFDVKEIPKLVDFAKETGKVQFMLAYSPIHYEDLDFLDPIFIELKTPQYSHFLPECLFSAEKEFVKARAEFDEIARFRFAPYVEAVFSHAGHPEMTVGQLDNLREDYLVLRALGKHNIADKLLDLLLEDPFSAYATLTAYHTSLFLPLLDGIKASRNVDLESFTFLAEHLDSEDRVSLASKIKFPFDIGVFLMKKLTPYPQSFRAMECMVDRYKQEDLYNVMEALNNALKSESLDLLAMKVTDLSEILDNVWKDSKRIQREIKEVDWGISLAFNVIGPVVGFMSAGITGLLAGLGLSVAETSIDFFGSIGEKIVKKLRPSYFVNIYDFKSKYSIE